VLLAPHGVGVTLPPAFTVVLDDTEFGPCPQLREVVALLDEQLPHGSIRGGGHISCLVDTAGERDPAHDQA
jgi:hypothetical protein